MKKSGIPAELRKSLDTVNKELTSAQIRHPDSHIIVPDRLHFAIKMLARRQHKTIQGVSTELLTAGIKALYYKLYMDYMRGPAPTYVDFKKTSDEQSLTVEQQ